MNPIRARHGLSDGILVTGRLGGVGPLDENRRLQQFGACKTPRVIALALAAGQQECHREASCRRGADR